MIETMDIRTEICILLKYGNMSTFEIARIYEISEDDVERILNEI